jgi:integrase
MAKTLTAVAVKNLRPGKARREVRDGGTPGLYMVIQPSGARSWCMRFRRPNGSPAKLTLGPVDLSGKEGESEPVIGQPLTLSSARRLAADVHRQRAMGRDVVADHDAAKRRRKFEYETRAASTFGGAARDFVEQHSMKRTRRWQGTARLLGLDPKRNLEVIVGGLAQRWADKPLAEIDGHDVFALIEEVRRSGVPGRKRRSDGPTDALARAMLATMSRAFSWLIQHRRVEKNPCAGVHRPGSVTARDRVLNDAEIALLWQTTEAVREPHRQVVKLLLLTGARVNEVAGMRRSELSDDLSTWSLPGARTKNKKPHIVPLPPLAREIIASVPTRPSAAGYIFTTTGATPISGWSAIKRRLDASMKIPPWRLHDTRRTFVTGLAELGIRPDVIELAVNHVSGLRGGIAGVYNRSELLSERRAALERWAAHVKGLVSGYEAKVVPLRGSV